MANIPTIGSNIGRGRIHPTRIPVRVRAIHRPGRAPMQVQGVGQAVIVRAQWFLATELLQVGKKF